MSASSPHLTVTTTVNAPIEKVWTYWTAPEHIMKWNSPSDDWHMTDAANDLRTGGKFSYTMAAKDGSASFNFGGEYTDVDLLRKIDFVLDDGRMVAIRFEKIGHGIAIVETFQPESENSVELQQHGWQAILDRFRKYTEEN